MAIIITHLDSWIERYKHYDFTEEAIDDLRESVKRDSKQNKV